MNKNKTLIHPLYLKNLNDNDKNELLTIPEEKNNQLIFTTNDIKKKSIDKTNTVIGTINFSDKDILRKIYNIDNWEMLYNYLDKNIQNNIKTTIDRLFNLCWKSYFDSHRKEIEYVGKSYATYFSRFEIGYTDTDLNKIIFSINKNNIENIHDFIIKKI